MECKFGCHERGNLHANERRTEAETKSDSQVENLINAAEFKANYMGEFFTDKLRTGYYNNLSQVYIMDVAKLETQTNLYLNTTAKLVPENSSFQLKPKALESLEDFNEVEE